MSTYLIFGEQNRISCDAWLKWHFYATISPIRAFFLFFFFFAVFNHKPALYCKKFSPPSLAWTALSFAIFTLLGVSLFGEVVWTPFKFTQYSFVWYLVRNGYSIWQCPQKYKTFIHSSLEGILCSVCTLHSHLVRTREQQADHCTMLWHVSHLLMFLSQQANKKKCSYLWG